MKITCNLLLILCFFTFSFCNFKAKSQNIELYSITADAEKDIKQAIDKAANEKKHVLLQIGGNWCPWCIKLDHFLHQNTQLDSILNANYVIYHLNYSKEQKNLSILERYGNPQRFGFPVLIVLNGKGVRIHTQETGLLEACKGSEESYDNDKIKSVLINWASNALLPIINK